MKVFSPWTDNTSSLGNYRCICEYGYKFNRDLDYCVLDDSTDNSYFLFINPTYNECSVTIYAIP